MRKIILGFFGLLFAVFVCGVFGIGGKAGAYIWCVAVFIVGPIALVASFGQITVLAVRLIRKKKIRWNMIFLALSVLCVLPISVMSGASPVTYPTHAKEEDTLVLQQPVKDGVYFGGKEYKTHAYWPSECYAYDIVKEPYETNSSKLESYGIFGENVICPINGTVIDVQNKEPDIIPNTDEYTSSLGNYIFLQVDGKGTYLILAHLKQGSVLVSAGEHVNAGEILAKVGNSGTTSEPHLHIQLQRENPLETMFPVCAEGLPIIFEKE